MPHKQRRYEQKELHQQIADFTREKYKIPEETSIQLFERLSTLYGETTAHSYLPELERIMEVYYTFKSDKMIHQDKEFDPLERFNEEDVVLITYGDIIEKEHEAPLKTLSKFCGKYLEGTINTLHILPFFPYTSDRGFSVLEFEEVNPKLGTWDDVLDLEKRYNLMFDGVINHISSRSKWFREFQYCNPDFEDFFVSFKSHDELSEADRKLIFRPRTSDVLTKFGTLNGDRYVWTTFSADQVDLNYKNPKVLIKILDVLLTYVRRGADILRLDAITYLWSEPGTSCVSLKETHEVVKLIRDVIKAVAPHVAIVTETNVPHKENISYFGNGEDEAHMVYNFALPPLVLHTFYEGDTTVLRNWLESLEYLSETTTYFNFLDSHDGIGVMGARGILSDEQIDKMVQTAVEDHGACVSTKAAREGGEKAYEINATWFSAINRENSTNPYDQQVKKFLASRSIALSIKGVPGIYFHSLLGSKNDIESVHKTNTKRDINREIVSYDALIDEFENEDSLIYNLNAKQMEIIKVRKSERSFHPRGGQKVLHLSKKLFSIVRTTPEKDSMVFCMTNVSRESFTLDLERGILPCHSKKWIDILSKKEFIIEDCQLSLDFEPYDILWLKPLD